MKSFEKEIKKRILLQTIKAVVIGVLVIIVFIVKVSLHGNIESVNDIDKGILIGLFFGGVGASIIAILKYRKILKTPEKLEELHIKETDERNRILTLKTCQTTLNMTYQLLILAAIIASFFSLTVLVTICVIEIVILLLSVIFKIYYSRKY